MEVANHKLEECGCCCEEQPTLQLEQGYAESDLRHAEFLIDNLEKQIESLDGWCMV